ICGGDRNVGQHNECEIRCHNCKEEHLSTDYKCVAVQCYRRDLIQHIQEHPESLPNDIQLFIPFQYRRQGDKTIKFNRVTNQALCFIMDKSGDQQYVEISKQLSSIPFAERQSSINKLFSTYAPILDKFTMKLLEVTQHLHLNINNGL
ncbi:unnamed protein product, partial [Rotaria sp. Silwood2]